jgi:proteasome lid subunit RPN8/RPN11
MTEALLKTGEERPFECLRIPRTVLESIIDHARSGLPLEVCGILGGAGGTASAYYPIRNTEASGSRFLMDPREQIACMESLREQGMEVLAFCHSHPSGPPFASAEDVRLAFYPDVLTVIISLEDRDNPLVGAFRIAEGTAAMVRMEITD